MILFGIQKRDGDDERRLFKKAVGPYELFLSIFFFRNHCLHLYSIELAPSLMLLLIFTTKNTCQK